MDMKPAAPYPPAQMQAKNPAYAEMMLGNIGGINSEMTAAAHYRYNHQMTLDLDMRLAELFHQYSIVEMHHLDLFSRLARLLGADPRMWQSCGCKKQYWHAGYVDYGFCDLRDMLRKALQEELGAIKKYTAQANCIADPYVQAVLLRIIEDERAHADTWEELLKKM